MALRFTVDHLTLTKAISLVERAVSSRPPMPVLSGILIEAYDQKVRVAATDLDTGIESFFPVDLASPGAVVVEGRFLAQIIRRLPGASVELATAADNSSVTITSGSADFTVMAMDPEDYPNLPEIDGKRSWRISAQLLERLIRQSIFASAEEAMRPYLTGVYITSVGSELRFVATDSNRLALARHDLGTPRPTPGDNRDLIAQEESGQERPALVEQAEDVSMLVPAKSLQEVSRLVRGSAQDEMCEITVGQNQAYFSFPDRRLFTRLIESRFPSYERVIPDYDENVLYINRQAFLSALGRASVIQKDGPATVILEGQGSLLRLTASHSQIGKSVDELEVEHEGEDFRIAFQTRYLVDGLQAMDCEEVRFVVGPGVSPAVLSPRDGQEFLYVVMPLRI